MPKSSLQFTLPRAIPAGAWRVLSYLDHLAQMNFDEIVTEATGLQGGGPAAVPSKVCKDRPATRATRRTGGSVRLAARRGVLSSWSTTNSTTCRRPFSLCWSAYKCSRTERTRPHNRTKSNRTELMHCRECARDLRTGLGCRTTALGWFGALG